MTPKYISAFGMKLNNRYPFFFFFFKYSSVISLVVTSEIFKRAHRKVLGKDGRVPYVASLLSLAGIIFA